MTSPAAIYSIAGDAILSAVGLQAASTGFIDSLLSNSLLSLFLIVASGLLIGRVRIAGVSLGSSAVLFTALALGYLGYTIPDGIGTLGIVLFIYSVGLTAGPSFFRIFRQHGKLFAILALVLVVVGSTTAGVLAMLFDLPADLAAGLFAGALTSTPGLAAAMEALPLSDLAGVGYGIAYPFGVAGIVMLVQLLPRMLKIDLDALDGELQSADRERRRIHHVLVEVQNPAVIGQRLADLETITDSNCQVTRVLRRNRLVPVPPDLVLESGQYLLVIGRAFRLERIIPFLGHRIDDSGYVLDTENQTMTVVPTSKEVVGKSLRDLRLVGTFGVTAARFVRHDLEFVPDLDDIVQWGDALVVVGEPDNLNRFARHAGHRASVFDQTDLISLTLGIIAGILLGSVSFGLGGEKFALGVVGGPMLVALIVGHFGHIGRIYASLPRASRLLMMELGLVLFLADAGVNAGGPLVEVLGQYGVRLCLVAIAATFVPLLIGVLVARKALRMNYLQILGGICGGATSTPGLGLITARSDSEIPVTSYAAAYPVALILMTVFARVLVAMLA